MTILRSLPTDPVEPSVARVALLSVHTSPLAQPGAGDGGGLNVYVLEVARRLARRGVHVDVFTRASSPSAPATVEVAEGLHVHHVRAGPPTPLHKEALQRHLSAFALELLRHETAGTHDVLHAHYWLSGWVGKLVAERWDIPLVQTFHTLGVVKNATLAPGDVPEPPSRLAAERRIVAAADRVVALTCGEARLLYRSFGLSGSRMAVVPAGVDIQRFRPGPVDFAAMPAVPAGEGPLLLFVGRLQPLKGPDVAVRTLAEVRRTHADARLLVLGGVSGTGEGRSGPAELRELAEELGVAEAVAFAAARPHDHLVHIYRAADVVLVPSRTESFGLVALEAQACGTPVVAADVGGLSAVVAGGGTLVGGHDPADHAAAVVAYLDDRELLAATREAGRRWAVSCSWDRTVGGLLQVYGRVLGREVRRAG